MLELLFHTIQVLAMIGTLTLLGVLAYVTFHS
jgi:hypothetical protein